MISDEDRQEKRGFKVEDRRRFSDSGDPRPEREEAAPQTEAPPTGPTAAERPAANAATAAERHQLHEPKPLEMNFSTFILSLSTQALAHLGEIPNPIDNQTTLDLAAAKQLIDILGLLRDKTKGNLDQTETGLLDSVLYDLRLKYVERVRARS
jgi:hypothetical protein